MIINYPTPSSRSLLNAQRIDSSMAVFRPEKCDTANQKAVLGKQRFVLALTMLAG